MWYTIPIRRICTNVYPPYIRYHGYIPLGMCQTNDRCIEMIEFQISESLYCIVLNYVCALDDISFSA